MVSPDSRYISYLVCTNHTLTERVDIYILLEFQSIDLSTHIRFAHITTHHSGIYSKCEKWSVEFCSWWVSHALYTTRNDPTRTRRAYQISWINVIVDWLKYPCNEFNGSSNEPTIWGATFVEFSNGKKQNVCSKFSIHCDDIRSILFGLGQALLYFGKSNCAINHSRNL